MSGGKPRSVAVGSFRGLDVTGPPVSSSRGVYVTGSGSRWLIRRRRTSCNLRRTSPWGTQWGQLDGPLYRPGMPVKVPLAAGVERGPVHAGVLLLVLTNFCRSSGGGWPGTWRGGLRARLGRPALKIVTWLILPVVICLSQRLSHACLSISNHTVKLRMAH
jgi:hypothetical protein